jgi:murein L,D-transpeptidase YafK
MRFKFLLLSTIILFSFAGNESFKQQQLKYARVQTAYKEKWCLVRSMLQKAGVDSSHFEMCIVVYKQEAQLQAWARTKGTNPYKLVQTYDICSSSGCVGPKRKEGDLQVPEGFYQVNAFQPLSEFYLALQVSYPNKSDKIKGDPVRPGGEIMIHGNCVTIGCMPLTDDKIKEVYLMAIEARNKGQVNIPICIFPTPLTNKGMAWLKTTTQDQNKISFWENLQEGYSYFDTKKNWPKIGVDSKGNYTYQ